MRFPFRLPSLPTPRAPHARERRRAAESCFLGLCILGLLGLHLTLLARAFSDSRPELASVLAHLPLARLDPDSASVAELRLLPGIGRVRAAAIAADRTRTGPFRSVEALERVHGIGPKTVARLRTLEGLALVFQTGE